MATKVKPSRLQVSGTPQAGQVPVYVDADTFERGDGGGGGVKVFNLNGFQDFATAEASRTEYLSGKPVVVMFGGNAYQYTTDTELFSDIPTVFSSSTISVRKLTYTMTGDNVTVITSDILTFTRPGIVDNLTTQNPDVALSANQGYILKTLVDNLTSRGRFLSLWNSATGLAVSTPQSLPYNYQTGDYFIVGTVGQTNYRPSGSSYTGTASTAVETEEVEVGDTYAYDGTNWLYQSNHGKTVTFSTLTGDPYDNANLANALNAKQDTINDLATIRSNAALGATALQSGDNISELNNNAGYTTCTGTVVAADLAPYQTKSCMVCNLSGADDSHYPSAKAVADAMACAGVGDMLKSVYDPNNCARDVFNYNNLYNRPTIPTNNCQLVNGCGYTTCTGTVSTCADVISALGYTPYSVGNPCNYINNFAGVISALGYTPYNTTNPNGYTTCTGTVVAADLLNLAQCCDIPTNNNQLTNGCGYITGVAWGDISGTLACQPDLCSALANKANDNAVVKLTGNQTVCGTKTFQTSPVVPSKTAAVTNSGTAIATEAQVYAVKQSIPTNNCQLTNGCGYTTCTGTISTCSQIISTLGYTPYNSTNPNGYTTCTGTLTAETVMSGDSGTTYTIKKSTTAPSGAGSNTITLVVE